MKGQVKMIFLGESEKRHINRIFGVDLAICILFYEKLAQTIECIQSFLPSGVKIYVLNNGSSPSARQKLEQFCSDYRQIKIFGSDVNLGVAVGRNYLITHTTEEWLFFVDSDIIVKTPDWLQKFVQHVHFCNNIEVFISRLFSIHENRYNFNSPFRIVGDLVIRDKKVDDLTNNFPGGASFINRKLFDRLDLYDDKMFVGLEDYELCIRGICLREPVKARHIYDIELIHNHPLAKKSEDRNAVSVRYDVNHIEASFNRIIEKHNLILMGDWKTWSAEEYEKISKNDNFEIKENWKLWAHNQFKKKLKQSKSVVISFASFVLPRKVKNILKDLFHLAYKSIPYSCSLYMTDRCDFKHTICNRSDIEIKEYKEMELATVQKLLLLYPSIIAFTILGLGEPTLCSNFVDVVDFLKKNGKFVGVITNGANSKPLMALTYEPDYISISLDGYDNESYLSNTNVAAFDKVTETFLIIKSKFKNVGFSYILNRANCRDLDKILLLCDDLKPTFLHLINYLAYDSTDEDEIRKIITVKDIDIIDYINKVCAGRDYIRVKPIYVDFDNPKFNCRSYNHKINLNGDGNIGGCQRQIPPGFSFGNIFTNKDPYNSSEMCKLRIRMFNNHYIHEECRFCFGNWES